MAGESAQDLRDERAFLAAPADPAADTATDALPAAARPRRKAALLALWQRLLDALRAACLAEWERGTAFLFLPVFLALGAVAYFEWGSEPAFMPLAATTAALAGAAYAARRHVVAHLLLLAALLVAMGLLAGKLESWRMDTRMLGSEIGTRITGRIVAIEQRPGGRARLTIDLVSTPAASASPPGACPPAPGRDRASPAPCGSCRSTVRSGPAATTSPIAAISTASAPAAFSFPAPSLRRLQRPPP
jgi:competence protein ComEC